MQHTTPKNLFRVWSDQSNGTNTTTRFDPASYTAQPGSEATTSPRDLGSQFRLALIGKEFENVPFIFFTSSFLFALVCAGFKRTKEETGIQITCIDTATATTALSAAMEFRLAADLMQELNVELRHSYADEYVAMSSVIAGPGSCTAALETLIENGLYQMYPALAKVNERKPCWYSALRQLRDYGSVKETPLTRGVLGVAARLAFCFKSFPSTKIKEVEPQTVALLIASVLAVQKRNLHDRALLAWLQECKVPIDISEDGAREETNSGSPEIKECRQLRQLLNNVDSDKCRKMIAATPSIDATDVTHSVSKWEEWAKQNREEWRATRGLLGRRTERNHRSARPAREYKSSNGIEKRNGYHSRKDTGDRPRRLDRPSRRRHQSEDHKK